MTLAAILYEDAMVAYTEARHAVFDMPGWTPTSNLTARQTYFVERLATAEAAVCAYRRHGNAA